MTTVAQILTHARKLIVDYECNSGCYAIDLALEHHGIEFEARENDADATDHPAFDLFEEMCRPPTKENGDYWFENRAQRILGFTHAIAEAYDRNI